MTSAGPDAICRIWRGWTTAANADAYENLLKETIFPGIVGRRIDGFQRIELLRHVTDQETEFTTLMWFNSMDAVRAFAGEAYATAVVPPAAQALLVRFDPTSTHSEVRARGDA